MADLYARAAVSLNSRLHSGVLAAGSLRPPVYLSNNAKYMDFMSSIGLQAYIVDPSRCGAVVTIITLHRLERAVSVGCWGPSWAAESLLRHAVCTDSPSERDGQVCWGRDAQHCMGTHTQTARETIRGP